MPTPDQIKIIHIAKSRLKLDVAGYRMILRTVAHVESSTLLNNRSFEDVMAVMEGMGFETFKQPRDYWRQKVAARGVNPSSPMVRKIHLMMKDTPYETAGMCRRMSGGRTEKPEELDPREAYNLIEALKAVHSRQERENAQPSLFPMGEAAPVAGKTHKPGADITPYVKVDGDDFDVPF